MKKKVIFITGTNSGFGWLYVHALSKAGHTVYATVRDRAGRNKQRADALAALPGVTVVEAEVTSTSSVKAAIQQVITSEGRLDILINNAGNFVGGLAETFTDDDLERMLDVHLKGSWRTIKEVLPQMRKQAEGLIINTSSVLGRFSSPFMTMYNSAKFGVEGLTEGLHYELRPLGIDVVLLQPGAYPTEIFDKAGQGSDGSVLEAYGELAHVPAKIGEGIGQLFQTLKPDPNQVADAVLQLVDTPNGKRPLRTVVDAHTGRFVETANQHVDAGYREFVTAFGLGHVLN